jgi:hypothetical protein
MCLNALSAFGTCCGLKVNAAKSAYAYVSRTPQPGLSIDGAAIPELHSTGFYKYLGAHTNFSLDDSKARAECLKKCKNIVHLIAPRTWLCREDKIELIKQAAVGILRFYANFTTFRTQELKDLENTIRRACFGKKRIPNALWCHLPAAEGGLGMPPIQNLCDWTFASNFLQFGVQSHLPLARQSSVIRTSACGAATAGSEFPYAHPGKRATRNLVGLLPSQKALLLLQRLGVRLADLRFHRQLLKDIPELHSSLPFLASCGLTSTEQLFRGNTLRTDILHGVVFRGGAPETVPHPKWSLLQNTLCYPGTLTALPHYLPSLPSQHSWRVPPHIAPDTPTLGDFPTYYGYVAFASDGSLRDCTPASAGCGVFFGSFPDGRDCKWNLSTHPCNHQSVPCAEAVAAEAALEIIPSGAHIIGVLDNESLFLSLQNWGITPEHARRKHTLYSNLQRIDSLCRTKHDSRVTWVRIDSHISEALADPNTPQDRKDRIRARLAALGSDGEFFRQLNEGADRLAQRASQSGAPPEKALYLDLAPPFLPIATTSGMPLLGTVASHAAKEHTRLTTDKFLTSPQGRIFRLAKELGSGADYPRSFTNLHDSVPNHQHRVNTLRLNLLGTLCVGRRRAALNEDDLTDGNCYYCFYARQTAEEETPLHLFHDCPSAIRANDRLFRKIKASLLANFPNCKAHNLFNWITGSSERHPLNIGPGGAFGLFPKALPRELTKVGIPDQSAEQTANKIVALIQDHCLTRYKTRYRISRGERKGSTAGRQRPAGEPATKTTQPTGTSSSQLGGSGARPRPAPKPKKTPEQARLSSRALLAHQVPHSCAHIGHTIHFRPQETATTSIGSQQQASQNNGNKQHGPNTSTSQYTSENEDSIPAHYKEQQQHGSHTDPCAPANYSQRWQQDGTTPVS